MNPETVHKLVREIEAKDASTAAHTWRVVLYLRAMLEARGVRGEDLMLATHGAALHDVGKLDIPESILQKPGKLTPEEFEVARSQMISQVRGSTQDVVPDHVEPSDDPKYAKGSDSSQDLGGMDEDSSE